MHILASGIAIIKQTYVSRLSTCVIKKNRLVLRMLQALRSLGYVRGFTILNHTVLVFMQYKRKKLGLRRMRLFSKMTNRIFLKRKNLSGQGVHGNYRTTGVVLLSTSYKGALLTN
jgi:ribosomal protein S8